MAPVTMDVSVSLDGFVAGPNASLEHPLGEGGGRLHEWMFRLAGFREAHGMEGGERDDPDDAVLRESLGAGAVVMGRKMFSGGQGPWENDPNADGWWGDDPPFHAPVFVVTHHPRETVEKAGGTSFVFVTDGVGAALDRAQEAADGRPVSVGGGASVARQIVQARRLDEIRLHIAPVLLGRGVRLFDGLGPEVAVEITRAIHSPYATHLTLRVGA